MQEWQERGFFEITENRLCNQAKTIRKNCWLPDLELENIRRMIEAESEIVNESIEDVEENQRERDIQVFFGGFNLPENIVSNSK